jgi:2-dehydro-3-deoxyphosphooctonate aldolase (KDO 8-P synthase)
MNTYIVGPCSLESFEVACEVLDAIIPKMEGKEWYFKGSFDKANRTNIKGDRGPRLDEGILIFKKIKDKYPNVKLITDIHESYQADLLKDYVDAIQIPAFMCKQTDLILAAAHNFDIINIKKGQWVDPKTIVGSISKVHSINPNAKVWVTERGSQFGYGQLLVDFGNVEYLKQHFDKVILDVGHSTQRVKENGRNGGDYKLALKYLKAAPIFDYDGVFVEVHPDPLNAISDQDSQIKVNKFLDEL